MPLHTRKLMALALDTGVQKKPRAATRQPEGVMWFLKDQFNPEEGSGVVRPAVTSSHAA